VDWVGTHNEFHRPARCSIYNPHEMKKRVVAVAVTRHGRNSFCILHPRRDYERERKEHVPRFCAIYTAS